MANAAVIVRGLQQWLQDWWSLLNASEVTGVHGAVPRMPGGLSMAVISYRDWPSSVHPGQR